MKIYTNFITKLGNNRIRRKIESDKFTKMSQYYGTIGVDIAYKMLELEQTNKCCTKWKRPWGYKHKEIPCKLFLFSKMYNRFKERVKYGKSRR